MGTVLIDNLSLDHLLGRYILQHDDHYKNDYHIQNYLYAIILWDDVCSVRRNSFSRNLRENLDKEEILKDKFKVYDIPYEYSEIELISEDIDLECFQEKMGNFNDNAREDAIFYLLLGYEFGMNVLLSSERAKFVLKSEIIKKIFSRVDIIEMLEKEVMEYYREVTEMIGKDVLKIKTPLLVDYVCSNAENFNDAVDIALELRENKNIKKFRATMDLIDASLNRGDAVEFTQYLKLIPEIVNQITQDGIKSKTINIGVSLSPSITIPFTYKKTPQKKRMINMNFLSQLAEYGLRGRKI